jgi:hypothetical protein
VDVDTSSPIRLRLLDPSGLPLVPGLGVDSAPPRELDWESVEAGQCALKAPQPRKRVGRLDKGGGGSEEVGCRDGGRPAVGRVVNRDAKDPAVLLNLFVPAEPVQ